MNVEIGTEAAQFPEKEYINGIFVAVQDGAWTDLFENLSVNSLKGDLSNATTFKPPLFLLVNTLNFFFQNR